MGESLLESPERVLSTLNQDGSRRWLRPRPSRGRFWKWRRVVAYALIAIFTLIPYIQMNGRPMVLLDIIRREFTFFGMTFLPTDTLLLALLMISVFVAIFLATALLGRVWCGWACPQTVYLEYVYRPIERLLGGDPGRRKKKGSAGLRKVLRFVIYLLVSAFLTHTFLSYFVGVANLRQWIFGSPLDHPIAFVVAISVTGLMLFDFGFFREQLCIVACPYGRFQSVLLDRASPIIGYDKKRGEPRGRARRKSGGDIELPVLGDCVDCQMCVETCPTGIDIREGLQMECVACAQCIDACDAVMDKIGRDRGLIRYASQESLETGRRKLLRPRVVLYPLMLAGLIAAFVIVLAGKSEVDVRLIRGPGMPYSLLDDGLIANSVRVRLTNRTGLDQEYQLRVVGIDAVMIVSDDDVIAVDAGAQRSVMVQFKAPPSAFVGGELDIDVAVVDGEGKEELVSYHLLGPSRAAGDADG